MPPFSPEQWSRASELLDAALELPPAERSALLDEACAADAELRARVEEMLLECEDDGPTQERPAVVLAAAVVDAVARAEGADPLEGRRLGPYRLVRELGVGGMGSVYLAERADDQFRKQVAIKLIRSGLATADVRDRFRNERQILATLEHPNIARLLDGGMTDEAFGPGYPSLPYLVMEYVEGEPLDHYGDRRRLSIADRVRLFCGVCAAVQHAHQHRVVHRDLKPSNILVSEDPSATAPNPTVKLLDFGIAKLLDDGAAGGAAGPVTRTGMQIMTPEYASPEQILGERVTPASDVYALGVVLYELLTGRRPYVLRKRSPNEIQRAVLESEPEKPSVLVTHDTPGAGGAYTPTPEPHELSERRGLTVEKHRRLLRGDLDTIVMKALRKEPDRRYASADDLRQDLERYLEGRPVSARTGALTYRASKLVRRNRIAIAGATAVLLLAASLVALYAVRVNRALSVLPAGDQAVVLGEFTSANRDSLLSGAVTEALRIDLAQSAAFRVAEPSRVLGALKRMGKPPTARLDGDLAREVAVREGIPAVIAGDVARAGTAYLLSARILSTESGDALAVARETARDSTQVIDAIDRLSKQLRGRLGESIRRLRATPPLERATTGSLEALQLYTQAVRAITRAGDFPRAIPLLERAIALDESFAGAHYALATALNNSRTQPERRIAALRRAFELRERLTAREQHAIAATYYRLTGNTEATIAEFQAAIQAARPGESALPSLHNNLGLVYQERREFALAERAFRTALAIDSTQVIPQMNLQGILLATGRLDEAGRVIDGMARRFPEAPLPLIARASHAGARGDLRAAEQEARGLLARFGASPAWKIPGSRMLAHALAVQGRLDEAEATLTDAAEASEAASNVAGHFGATLDLAALDLLLRGDTARAVARVDAMLRRFPLRDQPPSGRPYPSLALWYALAGNPGRARALLGEYEANELPEIRQGAGRMESLAQGALALAEGRGEEAVRLLRRADVSACTSCALPLLGAALERAGRPAEARGVYERYLAITWPDRVVPWPSAFWDASGDALWRARVVGHLAELDVAAGDAPSARGRLEQLATLWSGADPALRRRVEDARRRLAAPAAGADRPASTTIPAPGGRRGG